MKKYKSILLLLFVGLGFTLGSCSDDKEISEKPIMETKTEFSSALFGDSLEFSVDVLGENIPLSTLKARLYYTDEKVSETVIRTKTNGNYVGKIFVPFNAKVPNAKATLVFVLQNTNLETSEKSFEIALSRPDFPFLTLVTSTEELKMERTGLYQYEVTKTFPMKVKGYIKAPAVGKFGNEINFGWESNAIVEKSVNNITFSNSTAGEYSITFNTFSYEADPFIIGYKINGKEMSRIDDDNYKIDLDLKQGQEIEFGGIENINEWWIDPDFFTTTAEGKATFVGVNGKYRISASFDKQYYRVDPLDAKGELSTLQADGSGTIWAIGSDIGKPSVKGNAVGWSTEKGLALVYLGNKKHQISLVAGENIPTDKIDFKFFHQRAWGGEFVSTTITTSSDIIGIGTGAPNKEGNGNLFLKDGKKLTAGKTYVFTVDLKDGNDKAVLTVTEK